MDKYQSSNLYIFRKYWNLIFAWLDQNSAITMTVDHWHLSDVYYIYLIWKEWNRKMREYWIKGNLKINLKKVGKSELECLDVPRKSDAKHNSIITTIYYYLCYKSNLRPSLADLLSDNSQKRRPPISEVNVIYEKKRIILSGSCHLGNHQISSWRDYSNGTSPPWSSFRGPSWTPLICNGSRWVWYLFCPLQS